MSLTALNWKKIAPQSVGGAGAIDDLLDAIFTALEAATYADNSARTPGSGSAWTVSRFQDTGTTEAVYATPPTDTLNHRIIIAGAGGAHTPTMRAPDTWVADMPLASINKNSGVFNAWDDAAPFTSGQFFGFWKAAAAGLTWSTVHVVESQEALHVVLVDSLDNVYPILLGAFLDPESDDSADAESDDRLYGVSTQGTSPVGDTHWSASTTASFLRHGTGNNHNHCGVFDPGAGTAKTGGNLGSNIAITTQNLLTTSGRIVKAPILVAGTRFIGRAREIYRIVNAQLGQKIDVAAADDAYIFSGNLSADKDAWALGA